jgi:hypothetical protein
MRHGRHLRCIDSFLSSKRDAKWNPKAAVAFTRLSLRRFILLVPRPFLVSPTAPMVGGIYEILFGL